MSTSDRPEPFEPQRQPNPLSAEMRRLRQAILSLPKLQRDIFVACRVHGLSYDEIASHAGLSRREVERQLAKAICTVARRMNEKPRWWRHLF